MKARVKKNQKVPSITYPGDFLFLDLTQPFFNLQWRSSGIAKDRPLSMLYPNFNKIRWMADFWQQISHFLKWPFFQKIVKNRNFDQIKKFQRGYSLDVEINKCCNFLSSMLIRRDTAKIAPKWAPDILPRGNLQWSFGPLNINIF